MNAERSPSMDEIVTDFLVESHEALDQLDEDLLLLEQDPNSTAILGRIFRVIHTIKGTCGFLGFKKLEKMTHQGENLLSKLRDGEMVLNGGMTSTLLEMVDGVREILANVESIGEEGDEDYSHVVAQLIAHLEGTASATEEVVGEEVIEGLVMLAPPMDDDAMDAPPVPGLSEELAPELILLAPVPEDEPAPAPQPKPVVERAAPAESKVDKTPRPAGKSVSENSIRVDVALLEKLMNLVGELVLARNQILQVATGQEDNTFIATAQRLNLITTELQEGVMKTRMQPIGSIWRKFPRVVRDLARTCEKQVRVEMEGEETELDRTLIEAIKDPMTHIIRNAVDHGVEDPATRRAAGKPEEGVVFMRAFHEGGQVNIQIEDDGGGIDAQKVVAKAIRRGVLTPEEADRMSERDIISLIFAPGFSTAERITNVSGRGVGMDVVRTSIEKIGGSVDVNSVLGQGTTLKIKIPLTLAIIPALIVTCGEDRFAIPQVSLLELVRIEGENYEKAIEWVQGVPVYRLRGALLPLVYLADVLGDSKASDHAEDKVLNIVVLQADDRSFGLVVERINDTEEIVVKPLGKQLKSIQVFSGATIMGDGKVALILDVLGIAKLAKVVSEGDHERSGIPSDAGKDVEEADNREALLLFECGGGRMAMPLGMVDRLEEFPADRIEKAGDMICVQYRDEIMPLVDLSEEFGGPPFEDEEGQVQVVVYAEGAASIGLIVGHIHDIVEQDLSRIQRSRREGMLGVAIIQGKVTEVLDVSGFVQRSQLVY